MTQNAPDPRPNPLRPTRAMVLLALALLPLQRVGAACENGTGIKGGRERYTGTAACERVFRRGKDLPEIRLSTADFPAGSVPVVDIYLYQDTTRVKRIAKFDKKGTQYLAAWDWSNERQWTAAQTPVGEYTFKIYRKTGQDETLLNTWKAYAIFETPTGIGEAAEKAYLYSTGKKPWRDEESVQTLKDPDSVEKIVVGGEKVARYKKWDERPYALGPFGDTVFLRALTAVHGQTDPAAAAERLMNTVSNIIFYSELNTKRDVAQMFKLVSIDQVHAAAGGTEGQFIRGQCLDYAHALAAMCRAAGIPARAATDVQNGGFAYHQWTEVFLDNPPAGEDKWFTYDAMDYTEAPHTAEKDLAAAPVGKAERSTAPYGGKAYEVVVGDTNWKIEPGKMQIDFTVPKLTRVENADDQLFEKCENRKYDTTSCPAQEISPRIVDASPYVSVTLSGDVVRVGDVVHATVHLTNPDPAPCSTDLRFIVGYERSGADLRDSYGDPVLLTPGTGIFGTAIFDQSEAGILVPPGGDVIRSFQATVSSDAATRDWLAEARIVRTLVPHEDTALAPLAALAAFDVATTHPALAAPDDPIVVGVTIQSQVDFALEDLRVVLDIPENYTSTDPIEVSIPALAPGAAYPLSFHLVPDGGSLDAGHDFHVGVTSDNGGDADTNFVQATAVPATLSIPGHVIVPPNGASSFLLSFTLQNLGDEDAADVTVHLQSPDGISPGNLSFSQDVFFAPSLPGGEEVTFSTNATWSGLDWVHVPVVANAPGGLAAQSLLTIHYADRDGDEVPDVTDCAPDAPFNPVPGEVTGFSFFTRSMLSWVGQPSASYDVVRGSLSALPVGPGGGDELCRADNGTLSFLMDTFVPTAGQGVWYLVRAGNACGTGSYGSADLLGLPSTPRTTTTCP